MLNLINLNLIGKNDHGSMAVGSYCSPKWREKCGKTNCENEELIFLASAINEDRRR